MKQGVYVEAGVKNKAFYVVIAAMLFLMMSVNAYADTYNFFFDKNKKKQHTVEQNDEQVEEQDEAQSTSNGAAPDAPVAAPTAGGSPIVIHNNVNVPAPAYIPPPVPTPVYQTPSLQENTVSAAMIPSVFHRRPQWKFGLAVMSMVDRDAVNTLSNSSNYTSWATPSTSTNYNYSDSVASTGALLSMGYRFVPNLGMNLYVGTAGRSPVVGIDGEWVPLRLDVGTFDLLEVGGLLGVMTSASTSVQPHVGLRTNLNLGPHFGLTAALRVNKNFASAEAGVVVNL